MVSHILVENERYHYHKGFYIENTGNIAKHLDTIKNPRCDYEVINPYLTAEIFLHGSCDIFALALYEEFGFKPFAFVPLDKKDGLIHCFCVSTYLGMPAYVDVRGVTTDFEELICPFTELRSFDFQLIPFSLEETCKLEEEGIDFRVLIDTQFVVSIYG